jgi:hypothetical protein
VVTEGLPIVILGNHYPAGIRIKKDPSGIKPKSIPRIELTTYAICVDLAWFYPSNCDVPIVIAAVESGL